MFEMHPIGRVRSTRTSPVDDDWDAETMSVILDPGQFTPASLTGLADFSRVGICTPSTR